MEQAQCHIKGRLGISGVEPSSSSIKELHNVNSGSIKTLQTQGDQNKTEPKLCRPLKHNEERKPQYNRPLGYD
jgi:hypothetical protein